MIKNRMPEHYLKVVTKDGFHQLEDQFGNILPGVMWSDVFDPTDGHSVAIVKFIVNIGHPPKEEA